MEWKQKIFKQLATLYLKLRIGITNNNLGFDYLLNQLIQQLVIQIKNFLPDFFIFTETTLKLIFKTWISNYGILKKYGYLFVLIGYLGNEFDNQKEKVKLTILEKDILNNCILNLNIQQILSNHFFIQDSQIWFDNYRFLKQAMQNQNQQRIIIETLINYWLNSDSIMINELIEFKKSHNYYCNVKQGNWKKIPDDKNFEIQISLILETLLNMLDHMNMIDKDFWFDGNFNSNSIIDIQKILFHQNSYNLLTYQQNSNFDKWNDVIDFNTGTIISFENTSLSIYFNHFLGINLLYQYTHLNYLNQTEIVNYLETVVHWIPFLYQQICVHNNILFENKIFAQLTYSLKNVLKEIYPTINHDLNIYYQSKLTIESYSDSLLFDMQELIKKLLKNLKENKFLKK